MSDVNRHSNALIRRPRRLRYSDGIRSMVRQIRLAPNDFICPLFVCGGDQVRNEIPSMPGQFQLSLDQLESETARIVDLGIPAVILFGIPDAKDARGSRASADDGIVQQAIDLLKKKFNQLVVIADACLCQFTNHGHCGIVFDSAQMPGGTESAAAHPEGYLLNDPTLERLNEISLSLARAGADIVAPSGMIDGMVASIRTALDHGGFEHVSIMSYSVKYGSAYYGPFRDAADGSPKFGDRNSHQMDPAENRQPLTEAGLDIQQGADFLMVKPALAYLDVLRDLNQQFPEMPLVAYNVSGEYSMIKAASEKGWLDEQAVVLETLVGMKRAGADLIITYHAREVCQWLS